MANLSEIFNSVPALANATSEERQQVMSTLYDNIAASGALKRGSLRQMRDDQLEMFKADAGNQFLTPTNAKEHALDAISNLNPIVAIARYATDNPLMHAKLVGRNAIEDLKDVGHVLSDPIQVGAALGKTLADFGAFASATESFVSSRISKFLDLPFHQDEEGNYETPSFSEGLQAFNNRAYIRRFNEWYNKQIEQDPELYKQVHAALTDAAIGATLGIGRAVQASRTGVSALRSFMAPVVSTVTGGQLLYEGMERLDDALDSTDFSDETKTGIRVTALLAGAVASGLGPERIIENVITGNTQTLSTAARVGALIKEAEETGTSLKEVLAQNPDLDSELRQVLGLIDDADAPTVQILNDTLEQAAGLETKIGSGQELTIDEARMAAMQNPEVLLNPLHPDDIARELGELSSQPILARMDEEELARIDAEAESGLASPVDFGGEQARIEDSSRYIGDAQNGPEMPISGAKADSDMGIPADDVSRNITPNTAQKTASQPAQNAAPPDTAANKVEATAPTGQNLNRRDTKPDLGWDAIPLSRRALETLDILTSTGRNLQRSLKIAAAGRRTEEVARLRKEIEDIKGKVENAQKLITLEVGGSRKLKQLAKKEIRDIDKQLKELRKEWKAVDPETSTKIGERIGELQKRRRLMEDREIIFNRIPDKADADVISRIKKEREAAYRTRKPEPSKPYVEKITREDALTKLGELKESERMRAMKVTSAAQLGRESLLGRALTEEERLDVLQDVLNQERLWSDNPFARSETALVQGIDGPAISAGYIAERYPLVGRVLPALYPEVGTTGTYTPAQVLKFARSNAARLGIGMDATGWMLNRDITEETQRLFDDVKSVYQRGDGEELRKAVGAVMRGAKKEVIDKVTNAIKDAFPDLDVAFKFGDLPEGAGAIADPLTKLITIGLDKPQMETLLHELGHIHFWYGLDADTRMSWLDSMRELAVDEATWSKGFPGYERAKAALEGMDERTKANETLWLESPTEMYAQQFAAYALNNVIPNVETLASFQGVWRGLRRLMGASTDNWDNLSADAKEMVIKTCMAPSPVEAKAIPAEEIQQRLESSWLYSERGEAEARVLEARQMLEATYGHRTEVMPTSETDILETPQLVEQTSFFALPVEQRVASYALEDLPQVAEMHALSLLHDLPGASWDELRGVLHRLHQSLQGENRARLIDAYVLARTPSTSTYDPRQNPTYMTEISKAENTQYRIDEANNFYRSLDIEARTGIEQDNARRYKREYFTRMEAAGEALRQAKEAGKLADYTEAEVKQLADSIMEKGPGKTQLEGAAKRIYSEIREEEALEYAWGTTQESMYDLAAKHFAELDVKTDYLIDFTKNVLAAKGLSQPIDATFTQRLSDVDRFAKIAANPSGWSLSDANIIRAVLQGTYIGITGLEYDPDGSYIPFLGKVRWSPEKFLETAPLGVLLLPGGPAIARAAGKRLMKPAQEAAKKVMNKLPFEARVKLERLGQTAHRVRTLTLGLPTELQDAYRKSINLSRTARQSFMAFAETMHRYYTLSEREIIAKVYEGYPGTDKLIEELAVSRPDILQGVQMVGDVYRNIPNMFKKIGLYSERFEDVGEHYINRVYDGIGKKPIPGIFLNYGVLPIKGDFLKQRGIEAIVKNGRSAGEGASSIDALMQLRRNAEEAGVELTEGLKLNSWIMQDGSIAYSIPGSSYDDALRAQKIMPDHQWDSEGTGFVVTEVRKNSLKVRRDYTVAEREAKGEVLDISVRSAVMGAQLERDLRQGSMFYNVANSSFAKRATSQEEIDSLVAQGWVQVEDAINKETGLLKYGALSGMYIHPDAQAALKMVSGSGIGRILKSYPLGNTFVNGHKKLLSTWKAFKTVLSPASHVYNFASNAIMGYLMGHNVAKDISYGLQMSKLRNAEIKVKALTRENRLEEALAVMQQARQSEYWQYFKEVRDARMSDSSLWANEFKFDEFLDILEKERKGQDRSELGTVMRVLDAGYSAISNGVRRGVKFAGSWYEKGDLVYKMGAYVAARKAGRSPNEAVKYAYESYFDYGNLSPAAQALRDSGVVPFISYIYNVIPAMAKAITQHPERVAGAALMLEGMHLASIAGLYGPEDLIAKREAVDSAVPEYMRTRGIGGLFRTRVLNSAGSDLNVQVGESSLAKHQFFDMLRMIPGADLVETRYDGVDPDFSAMGGANLLYSVINQSPVLATLGAAYSGKTSLGQALNSGGNLNSDPVKDRAQDAFNNMVWNTIVPNLPFIPGTYAYNAIADAIKPTVGIEWGDKSGLDQIGLPKSLYTAVAGTVGLKFRDVYPELNLRSQVRSERYQFEQEKNRLKRVLRSPMYTQEYKEGELGRFTNETVEDYKRQQTERGERAKLLQTFINARRREQGGRTLLH